jgi:hypothetical protein
VVHESSGGGEIMHPPIDGANATDLAQGLKKGVGVVIGWIIGIGAIVAVVALFNVGNSKVQVWVAEYHLGSDLTEYIGAEADPSVVKCTGPGWHEVTCVVKALCADGLYKHTSLRGDFSERYFSSGVRAEALTTDRIAEAKLIAEASRFRRAVKILGFDFFPPPPPADDERPRR